MPAECSTCYMITRGVQRLSLSDIRCPISRGCGAQTPYFTLPHRRAAPSTISSPPGAPNSRSALVLMHFTLTQRASEKRKREWTDCVKLGMLQHSQVSGRRLSSLLICDKNERGVLKTPVRTTQTSSSWRITVVRLMEMSARHALWRFESCT